MADVGGFVARGDDDGDGGKARVRWPIGGGVVARIEQIGDAGQFAERGERDLGPVESDQPRHDRQDNHEGVHAV